jgi:type I restriction enzyme S subunit
MSARSDCRRTQIGDIPEEWEVVPIGKIAREVKSRNNLSENFTVFAITKHAGLVPSLRFFTKRVYSQDLSKYKTIERCQFAYSPIHLNEGAIGLLESEDRGLVSPLHVVFELLPEGDEHFFKFLFKSQRLLSSYARLLRGSINRRGAVLFRDFSRIDVQLPPRKEQEKIASILSTVDDAIQKTDEIISKTQHLKKGLMQQLLTKGMGHTKFKRTEFRQMPEEWETVSLRDVGEWYSGGTPSKSNKDYWGGEIPWISPRDMKKTVIESSSKTITKLGLEKGSRLVSARSILVVIRGLVLAKDVPVAMSLVPVAFNQDIKALVCSSDFEPEYVLYSLLNSTKHLLTMTSMSAHGTKRLPFGQLAELQIPHPQIEEQRRIASILNSVEKKVAFEKARKSRLYGLKRGLLQVLLTGKVRVRVS